jgi:hypothetical protein
MMHNAPQVKRKLQKSYSWNGTRQALEHRKTTVRSDAPLGSLYLEVAKAKLRRCSASHRPE